MIIKRLTNIYLLFVSLNIFSQNHYISLTIPDNLKENTNAVVRQNSIDITLKSPKEMQVVEKRIITVLNKEGNDNINAYVHYDNNKKIVNLQVLVFDAFGKQIKKIKKKDFKDTSAVDGGTLYSGF